jgi:uncharacterized membrane protein YebE (DUF533 family)
VAASDGNIDDKEAAALAKELQDAPFYVEPLAREVLMSVVIDLATSWSNIIKTPVMW